MPTITLQPMTQLEFEEYLEYCIADYASELVRAGTSEHDAAEKAQRDTRDVRSDGPDGERHKVMTVIADSEVVGMLWLGARDGWRRTWIYDICIDDAHQGKGLGRATLAAGEQHAASLGAEQIGLHVFAHNTVARRLYETSGYVVTNEQPYDLEMWKDLI